MPVPADDLVAGKLLLLVISVLTASGCLGSLHSQPKPVKWATGFWYWGGAAQPAPSDRPADLVYALGGRIWNSPTRLDPGRWFVNAELPSVLPPAHEYWVTFRCEQQRVPDLSVAPLVGREAFRLKEEARKQGIRLVGLQLDIDSPTGKLSQYADFLRAVRKTMPADWQLSITALLDWFDAGQVGEVIQVVDEFVPQFYDTDPPTGVGKWRSIAAEIDSSQWAPQFNRFGKRYRIGISSFGRASTRQQLYADLAPLDFAVNPAFELQTGHSPAGELILRYEAARDVRLGYTYFRSGDEVEFTMATRESVRPAVESARRMGGHCAGVVFFRWPSTAESLTMQPGEVYAALGLETLRARRASVDTVDGDCAAVSCVDVYLMSGSVRPSAVRYRIHSSIELEYFLPREGMPVRMAGPSDLEMNLPPYTGANHVLLGRAVTKTPAEFHVEEAR
jgi:hypothetical protein